MNNDQDQKWIGYVIAAIGVAVVCVIVCAGLVFLFAVLGFTTPIMGSRTQPAQPEVFPPPIEASPTPVEEAVGVNPEEETATEELMADIQAIVADMRGLDILSDVPKRYMSPEELNDTVVNDFFVDYTEEDARNDAITLFALDVVPYDFDLYQFYIDLYSEGIAGYYDAETDEFFLIGSGDEFTASDEWTFAHEYTHALQDQHFDLAAFLHYDDDDWYLENADAATARQALIEGDATLTSVRYFQEAMSSDRQTELLNDEQDPPAIYDTTPPFILRDFFFPYEEGYYFLEAVYQAGGFNRVDAAYDDPPTSTEQILHPEKYLDDRDDPQEVSVEDALAVLGESYREVVIQPFGEWYTRIYLEQFVAAELAASAGEGWDGGRLAVYSDDEATAVVMVLRLVWDSEDEAAEFGTVWAEAAITRDVDAVMTQEGSASCWTGAEVMCLIQLDGVETVLVRAPDLDSALAVLGQYP